MRSDFKSSQHQSKHADPELDQPSALPRETHRRAGHPIPRPLLKEHVYKGMCVNILWAEAGEQLVERPPCRAEYHLTGRGEPGTLCTTEPRAYHSSSCC